MNHVPALLLFRDQDDDHDPLKVKEVWEDGKRYIICKNERQARKDEATRNAILESLEEKLHSGAKSLIGNKGFKKYLAVKKNSVTIDKKKIEEEKRFDGKTVLPRPNQWGGFAVNPVLIEFWQGRPNRLHDRLLFTKEDSGWSINRLAP